MLRSITILPFLITQSLCNIVDSSTINYTKFLCVKRMSVKRFQFTTETLYSCFNHQRVDIDTKGATRGEAKGAEALP